jgi:hypothetical protein
MQGSQQCTPSKDDTEDSFKFETVCDHIKPECVFIYDIFSAYF